MISTPLGLCLDLLLGSLGASGARAELLVSGAPEPKALARTAAIFGVQRRPLGREESLFSLPDHRFGKHKEHGVRLLYFALALHRAQPADAPLRAYLHCFSTLRDALLRATRGAGYADAELHAQRDAWRASGASFSMDAVLVAGAQQAGLEIPSSRARLDSDWTPLAGLIALRASPCPGRTAA